MIIEVCAESYEHALKAEKAGADRIELCKDLHLDGLTPDYESAKKTIKQLNIPVFILIRPREGDFIYSNEEFELMKHDILKFKEMGCKGIVSGVLNSDNSIDIKRTKELIELSKPLEFTFHRAFDLINNQYLEIKNLCRIKAHRVLTSGNAKNALNGLDSLIKLQRLVKNDIKIIPGGSLSMKDIKLFERKGFKEIHGSFKKDLIKSHKNFKIL